MASPYVFRQFGPAEFGFNTVIGAAGSDGAGAVLVHHQSRGGFYSSYDVVKNGVSTLIYPNQSTFFQNFDAL